MDKSPEAFRTISEVAEALEIPAHVLRFWESRFPQIRPLKRAGGRRYYRPSDIELLAKIKRLLHEEGFTIKGAQRLLRDNSRPDPISIEPLVTEPVASRLSPAFGADQPAGQVQDDSSLDALLDEVLRDELGAMIKDVVDVEAASLRAPQAMPVSEPHIMPEPLPIPAEETVSEDVLLSPAEGAENIFEAEQENVGPIAPYIEVDSVPLPKTCCLASQIRALDPRDSASDHAAIENLATLRALLCDLLERLRAASK